MSIPAVDLNEAPDQLRELVEEAARAGEVVLTRDGRAVAKIVPVTPARSEAEQQVARERFERHFGEVDLGHATGVDNEQIDADLAGEYAGSDQPR